MHPHIQIGRLAGIQIGIHYSWLLIAVLITLSLGGHFREVNPGWTSGATWSAAIVTSLLFFALIVVHEPGHALVARP
jgi:Zn-dependent protease